MYASFLVENVMSDEKTTRSSSRKNLVTVLEQGENDDNCIPTGGVEHRAPSSGSCSETRQSFVSLSGKQTMKSSAFADASEKSVDLKGSFHAQLSRSFFQSHSLSYSSSVDGYCHPSRNRLGTVAVEDPLTHEKVVHSKVLLLYTGGALGWKVDPQGIHLDKNNLLKELKKLPMIYDTEYVDYIHDNLLDDIPEEGIEPDTLVMPVSKYGRRIFIDVLEMPESDVVVHSKDQDIHDWLKVAQQIEESYEKYHGFVILHGTDTMAYLTSALSFMFENLGKSIIFTGSQYALNDHLNDGRQNLLGAIMIAGHYVIPEVTLFFHGKLYRGNRVLKVDARRFGAFDSPNCSPLATVEAGIEVEWEELFLENQATKFRVHKRMSSRIGVLRIFPGITAEAVHAFLEPPIEGVVLETYGAGNGPDSRKDIFDEITAASQRGVIIVNCTQCLYGHVVDDYSTGRALVDAGVISGNDMTVEAALTKLSYVLGHDELALEEKKKMMRTNLRGELTLHEKEKMQQFCLRDNKLVDAVASHFKVGSTEEVRFIKQALFPVLMCQAAGKGDIATMKELCGQGGVLNAAASHDGRTPLHVACLEGQLSVIRHLLGKGASPHVTDSRGQTPLHDAIRSANVAAVLLLREFGAHLGPTTMDTALEMCALAADNKVDELRAWYLAGVDFNVGDYDRRTVLHVAVCQNNIKSVKFLLECGVDLSVRDLYGFTPLRNAELLGNKEMVEILQSHVATKISAGN
ncbi:60 kDa lysophospholipase-like isoform X1 [Montipora foliosa]|uniref:60 kDa lysophospholipase-like isoform X1 n=1 Tax=Montipora foliosa TaxID=591990 RepID=UPI0035F13581